MWAQHTRMPLNLSHKKLCDNQDINQCHPTTVLFNRLLFGHLPTSLKESTYMRPSISQIFDVGRHSFRARHQLLIFIITIFIKEYSLYTSKIDAKRQKLTYGVKFST